MAPKQKEFAPELIAEGRRRYELTNEPVDAIAVSFGLGRTRMNQKIGEWGWARRRYTVPAAPPPPDPEPPAVEAAIEILDPPERRPQPPLRDPVALGLRLAQVVERELDVIERVLDVLRTDTPAEAERSARTLATISRSLREVAHASPPKPPREAADDDTVPRDLDQLRSDVGRRLDRIVDDAKALFADPGD